MLLPFFLFYHTLHPFTPVIQRKNTGLLCIPFFKSFLFRHTEMKPL
ncbi:hypothetical protein HMPREF9406_1373 [Clostridium sp. HGF2]|nr:hypothetical protein HMPREF9406_1373 [Clostridium sp. HGF2]EQJ63532.1 hypothetical protein QSI_0366 [Clostridioides difficile P28]